MSKTLALVLLLGLCGPVFAQEVPSADVGDTTAEVEAKLGKPMGILSRGKRATYSYERGMVDFVDGRVVHAYLVSPEEAARIKAERERAVVLRRQAAEADRKRLTEEGQAELTKATRNADSTNSAPSEGLAYWKDFARRYPYTDVSRQIAAATVAVEEDKQRQGHEDGRRSTDLDS